MKPLVRIITRQRHKRVNIPFLRSVVQALLSKELQLRHADLGIYLVDVPEMVDLNETHLRHSGVTDVITFDYTPETPLCIHGEMFVCVPEATRQAESFRVTWQNELARYIAHGVLHLCGFNDDSPVARKKMKHIEDRVVSQLDATFDLGRIEMVAPEAQKRSKARAKILPKSSR